ncbi:MAG TPA: amidohydrolase family protein, partial [Thermoanaerobaculia bacterium]
MKIGKPASLALVVLILPALPLEASAEVTALRFAQLVNPPAEVVRDAVVVVQGDRVTKVGSGDAAVPAGARVIDLRPLTAIPGMIDVHTHMSFYWDRKPGTRPWTQLGRLSPAVTAFLARENARRTLETGVTAVRDLGSWQYVDIALKDLIQRGAMPGPRMFVAGYGLSISRAPSEAGRVLRPGEANGIAEVQRVAREQIGAGADWIKMYGSTGSDQDVTGFQTFSFEEMKA